MSQQSRLVQQKRQNNIQQQQQTQQSQQRSSQQYSIQDSRKGSKLGQQIQNDSFLNSQSNLDQTNPNQVHNIISENSNFKRKKRYKLEEAKEQRIQEFLAAKRKEYEKYISLDFDYKIVEEEINRYQIIDYSNVDKDEERKRMRINKTQMIQYRLNNLLEDDNSINNNLDNNINFREDEAQAVQRLIDNMRIYITPLQDNFSQTDDSFKAITARNTSHYLLGPPKFCGSVFKKINDKCVNEEVWVVVRGYYVFLYQNQDSERPSCMLRIPLNKIILEVTKGIDTKERGQKVPVEFQYFSLVEKATQSIHFFIGKKSDEFKSIKNNFYEFLKKQVAIKTYLFLCGYLNTAPDQSLLRFFENDDSSILKINLETETLDNLGKVHPVLKPISEAFFYYTFLVASMSKNLMVIDFTDLCLWSNFLIFFFSVMKDDNVNCLLRVLKLDNNDITDEVLLSMLDYFKKPQSFFITHLSLNRISDLQPTGFILIGKILSERHYCIRDSVTINEKYELPFQYLSLNDVGMNDNGLSNIVINLEKIQKDNYGRGIVDYETNLELHLAKNNLTESSLRSLGFLLESFQAISVLNISESDMIKCISKEYFFNCLKKNYSLINLNISRIDMNIDAFRSLISMLEENFTLQTIQITLNELMVNELSRSRNVNLLKYFMISYNPQLIFENS